MQDGDRRWLVFLSDLVNHEFELSFEKECPEYFHRTENGVFIEANFCEQLNSFRSLELPKEAKEYGIIRYTLIRQVGWNSVLNSKKLRKMYGINAIKSSLRLAESIGLSTIALRLSSCR